MKSRSKAGRHSDGRPAGRSTKLIVGGASAAAVVMLALAGYGAANAGERTGSGASATGASAADCIDTDVAGTVEENRLEQIAPGGTAPVGPEIIRRGGFAATVSDFASALCGVKDTASADATIDRYGRSLWEAAVARAQGADPTGSDALAANDDRPLYWTRLAMARELRQWKPGFSADQTVRDGWEHRFEYASRGMTTESFTAQAGVRKLFVSGFDPFQLDNDPDSGQDVRHSNPSGAAALQLDGKVLTAGNIKVQVQAVMLPVRFHDFDNGIVEDAFRQHVAAGDQHADMLTTTSQGEPDRFDLEVYNGRPRSELAQDNNGEQGGGARYSPSVPPGMGPGPGFTRSSLPLQQMQAAGAGGRYPVEIRTSVTEIKPPAPGGAFGTVEVHPNGPTSEPGWDPVAGGGGGFLSNESAYRVTRLVYEAGSSQPAGHLHTPAPTYPADATQITDANLVATRGAIVDETIRILTAGAAA